MSIYTERSWISACDECEWISCPCDWYDWAETLLDEHIRSEHGEGT